jgi:hypothetical protein
MTDFMGSTRAACHEGNVMGRRIVTLMLEEILGAIPTVFGKLAWISSFRVAGSGEYRCADLEDIVHPDMASSVLRDLHNRLFDSWLILSLREQSRDFAEYLGTLPSKNGRKESLFGAADELVPPGTKVADKSLFETDFALVLECSKN